MPDELLDIDVAEIMRRWPDTIRVFLDCRLHCVGCPIGRFHTLADAAAAHAVDLDTLSREIAKAIRSSSLREGRQSGRRQAARGDADR